MTEFTIRFWGTRGSIPTPGRRTEKYGGNTTCVEVRHGETILIFDAGSGIRELSGRLLDEFQGRPIRASLLFTHVHWDHIQGFPFFAAAYIPGNTFDIYGEHREHGGVEELLGGQMQAAYFPVSLSAMHATLQFHATTPEFAVGPLQLRTLPLPHPGGCLGYRLEVDGKSLVFATDCELDRIALNADDVQRNHFGPRHYPPEFLDFFANADLIVIDCQYTDSEFANKRGWGHNSVSAVVDLCLQATPHAVALTHHDPSHDDVAVGRIATEASVRLQTAGLLDTLVFAAREGLTMRVRKPQPPLSLAR
jgi:phosphoribosyl 1,2-cyclic phosphodiesterase